MMMIMMTRNDLHHDGRREKDRYKIFVGYLIYALLLSRTSSEEHIHKVHTLSNQREGG